MYFTNCSKKLEGWHKSSKLSRMSKKKVVKTLMIEDLFTAWMSFLSPISSCQIGLTWPTYPFDCRLMCDEQNYHRHFLLFKAYSTTFIFRHPLTALILIWCFSVARFNKDLQGLKCLQIFTGLLSLSNLSQYSEIRQSNPHNLESVFYQPFHTRPSHF